MPGHRDGRAPGRRPRGGADREDDPLRELGGVAGRIRGRGRDADPVSVSTGKVTSIEASPEPSVVTWEDPEIGFALEELPGEVGSRPGWRRTPGRTSWRRRRGSCRESACCPRPGRPEVLDGLDDGEVLETVRAGVGVARVVDVRPVAAQIDPEPAVGEDGIRSNRVSRPVGVHRNALVAVERDAVAGPGARASDRRQGRVVSDEHAKSSVAQRRIAVGLRPDEVALDDGAVRQSWSEACRNVHAVVRSVAGNDVSRPRTGATDRVVGGKHVDSRVRVRPGQSTGRISTEEVPFDVVPAQRFEENSVALLGRAQEDESIDDQPSHCRAAGRDAQPARWARVLPVQFDLQGAVEAGGIRVRAGSRLAVAVDGHGIGDDGERRGGRDRVHAGPRDGELDRVGARSAVGVDDRLAQRAGAGVVRVRHREGRGRQGMRESTEQDRGESLHRLSYCRLEPTTGGEPSTEGRPAAVGNAGRQPGGIPRQ